MVLDDLQFYFIPIYGFSFYSLVILDRFSNNFCKITTQVRCNSIEMIWNRPELVISWHSNRYRFGYLWRVVLIRLDSIRFDLLGLNWIRLNFQWPTSVHMQSSCTSLLYRKLLHQEFFANLKIGRTIIIGIFDGYQMEAEKG